MDKISTKNLVLKSIYEKLTPREMHQLENVSRNEILKIKNQYYQSIALLGDEFREPSQSSIDIILKFSQSTSELDPIA